MFKKGANPFAKTSQEPIALLESITPMELASCVPFVKIVKIDRLGRPDVSVRPLMYDLIQSPRFAGGEDSFGMDSDTFIERALVSLQSVTVEAEQQYGIQLWHDVKMEFIVHHPDVVFNADSKNSWREILMDGKSFTLEYGWRADTNLVRNPLFNGEGHVTESGLVLQPSKVLMLNISTYDLQAMQTGEVKVTIKAKENGDLALREMRFSDAFQQSIGAELAKPDDTDNLEAIRGMISKLHKKPVKGKSEYYLMGDILDNIVAPMVISAAKAWGYTGVDLLLGNFNNDSCPQSEQYFGSSMAGKGIENFKIPADVLMETLQFHLQSGRALLLQQFISMIINAMNSEHAWYKPTAVNCQMPQIMLKADTIQDRGGSLRLVLSILDVTTGSHPFGMFDNGQNRITLDNQSRSEVFKKLGSLGVPVLEFSRASSLILDANFNLQPDPMLQAIQNDLANQARKDRVQQATMPDVESRKGQARNGELRVPVSILEGEIAMHGNFAMEVFGKIWVEFFGSKEISGIYNVRGKTDTVEAGSFKSSYKVISEGIDPLNTRWRRTDEEFKVIEDRKKAMKAGTSKTQKKKS